MRDRLIELIEQAENQETMDFLTADLEEQIDMSGGKKIGCSLEYLVYFLLEHGVIVPPCKVGDIVYLFYPVRKGIYEAVVDEISLSRTSNFIVTRDLYFNRRQSVFFEQFGKTVFLTKEEAEKALRGEGE